MADNVDNKNFLAFLKMHGLGNDFVVIDGRPTPPALSQEAIRALADRRTGVGCDQVALIETDAQADVRLSFWNPDGSRAGACGNATRCIAAREMALTGAHKLTIRTDRGTLAARDAGDGLTSINMGAALTDWRDIPLSRPTDALHLPLDGDPVATGMGNPHCTFFVENVEEVDLARLGPQTEHDPLFPERTNVQIAQRIANDHLRVRVWERAAGITPASGSSACAAAVAANRRSLVGSSARITLDGGDLQIDIQDDGVWMTGPTTEVFNGQICLRH